MKNQKVTVTTEMMTVEATPTHEEYEVEVITIKGKGYTIPWSEALKTLKNTKKN